jgi:hypothetical protein
MTIFALFFLGIASASADNPPTDQEIFSFIQEAFQAQLSLGEKHRSLPEIEEKLNPYFSKDYQENFLSEHLFQEEQGYITYGTDFPAYYIPFFSYDDETKIARDELTRKVTVYEFFKSEEDMPSLYDDHYEFIQLEETEEGWRVVEYGIEYSEHDFLQENVNAEVSNVINSSNTKPFITYTSNPQGVFALPYTSISAFAFYHSFPMFAYQLIQPKPNNMFMAAR